MFGLISKKKIIDIVKPLAKEYNKPIIKKDNELERLQDFYYRCGNCNAINAIMSKLGIKLEEYIK